MQNKPHLALDGYKTGHKFQYPEGTEFVYSNLTARSSRLAKMPKSFDEKVVFVGLQGFFNEFLKPELDKHRKVFEVVGSKMKVDSADDQLSGLGFSSTQKNAIICRVTGSFTRTIKVTF